MNRLNEQTEPLEIGPRPLPGCPDCGSTDSRLDHRHQTFQYGRGAEAVELTCNVPVYECDQCGYEWTGAGAEDARQVAVCRHLGRLAPDEVRNIRERRRLSQAEFSRITGFGEASLSRWETGAQVQNASNDRLLRLIQSDVRNLHRLQGIAEGMDIAKEPRLRVIEITPALRARQVAFQLQRAS